jgi:glycerol-3-phosphate dehydrogenase (NAD(P)+)
MIVSILGAGTWGTALGILYASKDYDVRIWSALPEEIDEINATGVHPKLPGVSLPQSIVFTKSMEQACEGADMVVFATPSAFIRQTARAARSILPAGQVVVSVAKGIECDTLKTMTGIIAEELEGLDPKIACLSGPTHAEEVSRKMPTVIVAASDDEAVARFVQDLTSCPFMRVYVNDDMQGVELCGAVKNVIALASGISSGLGYGDNARAAIITRGLAEMTRLGRAAGCCQTTFDGLAGLGDLVVTCSSEHSRNNRAGRLMGEGLTAQQATREVGMVVEGLAALPAIVRMARENDVDMPIVFTVDDIVAGRMEAADALSALYGRDEKAE